MPPVKRENDRWGEAGKATLLRTTALVYHKAGEEASKRIRRNRLGSLPPWAGDSWARNEGVGCISGWRQWTSGETARMSLPTVLVGVRNELGGQHMLAVADGVVYAIGGTAECTIDAAVAGLMVSKELG